MPTGGGKTLIFSYITVQAAARGLRVLILVHRQELLQQCSHSLDRWEVPHGLIAQGYRMTGEHVQVASVGTVVNRLQAIAPPDLIIIDEAHHAVAATWSKIVSAFPAAKLLGVTATPQRLDGKGLGLHCPGGFFDDLILGPSVGELIEDGFLVKPRVFATPRGPDLSRVRTRAGDYSREQIDQAMRDDVLVGDAVAHYARLCPGTPAIAFCCSIDHAEMVAAKFRAAGFRSRRIDGTMHDRDRADVVADLSGGELDVMTSVDVVSEGFDVPVCGAAILLRPTQSLTLYLQQVGRALRPHPGKEHAFILDHAKNTVRHGLPQEERSWSLDGAPPRDPAAAPVRMCDSCFAMIPAQCRICPECGHQLVSEPQPRALRETVEVDLVEVDANAVRARQIARAREVAQADTRQDLERIARERGYNPRWVDHIISSRNGGRR